MVSKKYKQFSVRFIHIALGFIVFTLPTSSIADTRYVHFEVLEISFNDLAKPIANYKVNAKSVMDCSRKCFNSDTCLSVVYHQEKDECYFNTHQVFLQPGAVIPSLSSSHSLVPLTAVSTVYLYACLFFSLNVCLLRLSLTGGYILAQCASVKSYTSGVNSIGRNAFPTNGIFA